MKYQKFYSIPSWIVSFTFFISLVPTDGYPDIKMNVKFVQDTSKFWYKPDISREQGERTT